MDFQDYRNCVHLDEDKSCKIFCTQHFVSNVFECKQYHGEHCCYFTDKLLVNGFQLTLNFE